MHAVYAAVIHASHDCTGTWWAEGKSSLALVAATTLQPTPRTLLVMDPSTVRRKLCWLCGSSEYRCDSSDWVNSHAIQCSVQGQWQAVAKLDTGRCTCARSRGRLFASAGQAVSIHDLAKSLLFSMFITCSH
jgi:adenylylsulfate kinase-like enzyme